MTYPVTTGPGRLCGRPLAPTGPLRPSRGNCRNIIAADLAQACTIHETAEDRQVREQLAIQRGHGRPRHDTTQPDADTQTRDLA